MLTVKQLENLKPGPTRVELADGRGLFLVVHPTGRTAWALRYRTGARTRKFTIGLWPAITLKEARERADRARVALADGRDPGAEKIESRRNTKSPLEADRVENVIEAFMSAHCRRKLRTSSAAEVARLLRKELATWTGRPLSKIEKSDVHAILDAVIDRGAPITANRLLAWLKTLYVFAIDRGIVKASPCQGIKAPSAETSRDRALSDEEIAAVWHASEGLGWPYRPLVRMLILTGQRRTEVAGMRWSEIDLSAKIWTLPGIRAKNGREHTVPLSDQAADILRGLPRIDGSDFVFTFSGQKPLSGYSLIKNRLDSILPADMQPWTLHDIRRSVASGLARLGTNLPIIEKVLNHVSGSFSGVAGVYQRHSFADEKRAALAAWARHVESIANGGDSNIVELTMRMTK